MLPYNKRAYLSMTIFVFIRCARENLVFIILNSYMRDRYDRTAVVSLTSPKRVCTYTYYNVL